MKLIRTLFLLALACGDPATVVEPPQAQGGAGTALPPAPGLADAAPPAPVVQPDPVDAGAPPVVAVDEPDATPPVVVAEPDAGPPPVEPPVLIPGSSNVFCACLELVQQVVVCEPPSVNCSGPSESACNSQEDLEEAFWRGESNDLQISYGTQVSTSVSTQLQDVCPLQLPFTYVDSYPIDNYNLPNCLCIVQDIRCTVTETLTRSCV